MKNQLKYYKMFKKESYQPTLNKSLLLRYYKDNKAFFNHNGICYIPDSEILNDEPIPKSQIEQHGVGYTYYDLTNDIWDFINDRNPIFHYQPDAMDIVESLVGQLFERLWGQDTMDILTEMANENLIQLP